MQDYKTAVPSGLNRIFFKYPAYIPFSGKHHLVLTLMWKYILIGKFVEHSMCKIPSPNSKFHAYVFLEEKQCEKDKTWILVHYMSGKNMSPPIVMAYLMKCRGWKLA